jgi:hypothetical protein
MKRALIIAGNIVVLALLVVAFAQVAANGPTDLAGFVPPGPLLYLEAKDFHSLVRDWNGSEEKKLWVGSDNYEVFSRSRLFLRFQQAQNEFAAAAGVPPNMDLLEGVAGGQSALALYDIGALEFLYITRMPADRFAATSLWKTRGSYQTRQSAGLDYFVKTDSASHRTAAFAASKDMILLATREDVLASSLALVAAQSTASVKQEPWFDRPVKAAQAPGEVRMVLDLARLGQNPYFRSYWIQRNSSHVRQYGSGIADVSRESGAIRENRILFRAVEETPAWNEDAVGQIVKLAPANATLYRAWASPSSEQVFALVRDKILEPRPQGAPPSQTAPQVALGNGETGNESDLETRIDEAPLAAAANPEAEGSRRLLASRGIDAMMQVQSSRVQTDQVFVSVDSAVVLLAASDWDRSAVAPVAIPLEQAGPLSRSVSAVSGRFLVLGNRREFVQALMARVSGGGSGSGARYAAFYQHSTALPEFLKMMRLIDNPLTNTGQGDQEPAFFSRNLGSLGQALGSMNSESISVHDTGSTVTEAVVYQTKR